MRDGQVHGVDIIPFIIDTAYAIFCRTVNINDYHRELLHLSKTSLDMIPVCKKLNSRYENIVKHAQSKEEEKEFAVSKSQYNNRCTNCAKYGHKLRDC